MTHYRELTLIAVILGIAQGILLNIAFVYIALKLGFSLGGSVIAAMLGYALLKGVFRRGTIIENNLNQTIASSINNAGTGVAFVLPAAFLLAHNGTLPELDLLPLLLAGIAGAFLGVLFIIPLRKQLIEIERLRYPSGVAVATVLQSGALGLAKVRWLIWGALLGGAWKGLLLSGTLEQWEMVSYDTLDLSLGILPAYFGFALYLSPLVFAAGLLSGRPGLAFFFMGLLAWWLIAPLTVSLGWLPPHLNTDSGQSSYLYQSLLKPLGIGILIGAAVVEVIFNFKVLRTAIQLLRRTAQMPIISRRSQETQREEMPISILIWGGLMALLCFFIAISSTTGMALGQALFITGVAFVWLVIASLVVAQCTGRTDISPLSGMALISVALMLVLVQDNSMVALLLAVLITVAMSQAADLMQDLKTGFLVGSRPFLQQALQLSLAWIGVVVGFGVVWVLWQSQGFGPHSALPAPQATALAGVIETVHNETIPLDKFLLGGLLGMILGSTPISGLGILSGLAIYLPFAITLTYGLGVLMHLWFLSRYGLALLEARMVPFAAGLIIGEALIGVGDALWQVQIKV